MATLPTTEWTLGRILAHQQRRGPCWALYEANQPWPQVRGNLQQLFLQHRSILLDGIASMLWMQATHFGAARPTLEAICDDMLDLVSGHRLARNVTFVDCAVPFSRDPPDYWFNALIRHFHVQLRSFTEGHQASGHGALR